MKVAISWLVSHQLSSLQEPPPLTAACVPLSICMINGVYCWRYHRLHCNAKAPVDNKLVASLARRGPRQGRLENCVGKETNCSGVERMNSSRFPQDDMCAQALTSFGHVKVVQRTHWRTQKSPRETEGHDLGSAGIGVCRVIRLVLTGSLQQQSGFLGNPSSQSKVCPLYTQNSSL